MSTLLRPPPAPTGATLEELNRDHIVAALAEVRQHLEAFSAGVSLEAGSFTPTPSAGGPDDEDDALPRLERLVRLFGLSPFERSVLVLAASLELESSFAALCAQAQGEPTRTFPTFSLALAALPGAHWTALAPTGPLRYWRLVELAPGAGLTGAALSVDERLLHYLLGLDVPDAQLAGLAEALPEPETLPPSHLDLARRVAATWSELVGEAELPIVQLCGPDTSDKRAVAAGLCALLDLTAYRMSVEALPTATTDLERVLSLWRREAALARGVLVLDCDGLDGQDAAREGLIRRVLEGTSSPTLVLSEKRRRIDVRPMLAFDVGKPTLTEQRTLWLETLTQAGRAVPPDELERLVGQFHLSAPRIEAAVGSAIAELAATSPNVPGTAQKGSPDVPGTSSEGSPNVPGTLAEQLWQTCRLQARPRLDDLAQRIDEGAGWDDLILPESTKSLLREVVSQVRWRHRVHETWGFARRGNRGLGIAALFAGASGTGKTMAAEVVARAVGLDLYRIDLSAVVSKYIGETEKNLQRIFDAAETGGAILLFDEADALFGKRTEVQDSHDRYANIEVSYLLQRMESYRGLAVLTSNLKEALDPAFLRRFRFILDFPFPGPAERAEIWRRVFPRELPTEGLDYQVLARLNVAGGSIKNIALNAAFLAADAGEPVTLRHVLRAARREYAKQGQTVPDLGVVE